MKYWKEYTIHEFSVVGTKNKIDTTVYSFDIETTSYLILPTLEVISGYEYLKLSKFERENCLKQTNMYIWMFGINDVVYYGRTWKELIQFLDKLEENSTEKKVVFVHNLSFEFQYLKSIFHIEKVQARKARKVMRCELSDYNIEFRCTYFMSNAALAQLPKLFKLPVAKKAGDLDYSKLRNSKTELTEKELGYCEYDCLVVYYYIKHELEEYKRVDKIPLTSTGHVRRELKSLTYRDYSYKRQVNKAINTDPHVYNMLVDSFAGGYTHANWIYADEVITSGVDSWDFTSSYPFVMVSEKYPATEFKPCKIERQEQMLDCFAYLIKVRFYNIKSNYYNNFISSSKCNYIKGAKYDNGRIMSADEICMTLTDIDFKFILDSHTVGDYKIEESYYSQYKYLPKLFINFILDKYVNKTQFKGVKGMELEYSKEKNKFNALYGMSVTNLIRPAVEFSETLGWTENELTNREIEEKLEEEKKKSFLSFAYGVWVTAYARRNLLTNVCKLDEYVLYCDTDSIKLIDGYDKRVIEDYNTHVLELLDNVSKTLDIDINRYMPVDYKGVKHPLGVFDDDGHYEEFVTQGAKKYAYRCYEPIYGFKKDYSFKKEHNLHITVAGVPKSGVKSLNNSIEKFKDDLEFKFEDTNKLMMFYCEDQQPVELTDYLGNKEIVTDKSGCCLVPTTYILSKALEYAELVGDSSKRAKFKE